jgi:hypothetical protein
MVDISGRQCSLAIADGMRRWGKENAREVSMPKMKREIGGKDGREQGRLSSDERARLGGSQAADVSEVGADRVNVAAVARLAEFINGLFCSFSKGRARRNGKSFAPTPYLIRRTWSTLELLRSPTCLASNPLVVHLEGKIVMTSDYRGCVYCLDRTVFRCGGCRTLNCMGASRPHDDHTDGLCGRCNKWVCLQPGTGKRISMSDVDGCTAFPNSKATEVEFLYHQQLARGAVEDTKKVGDSSEQSGKMVSHGRRGTKGLLKGKRKRPVLPDSYFGKSRV